MPVLLPMRGCFSPRASASAGPGSGDSTVCSKHRRATLRGMGARTSGLGVAGWALDCAVGLHRRCWRLGVLPLPSLSPFAAPGSAPSGLHVMVLAQERHTSSGTTQERENEHAV